MNTAGKLFVFEGPDGVGKTSIIKALSARFAEEKIPEASFSFPGKDINTLGGVVNHIHHGTGEYNINNLNSTSLQLLHVAAHIDTIERNIIPALKEGKIVLLDRFWWSTAAYGKLNGVARKSLKKMIELEKLHWRDVKPDCIFFISRFALMWEKEHRKSYNALISAYESLIKKEEKDSRVVRIENDDKINDAVDLILKEIEQRDGAKKSVSLNKIPERSSTTFLSHLLPVKPSKVFNTYWQFAAERQKVFFNRIRNLPHPWSEDSILQKYKFTNAYRASDRVSQYLIKEVIYKGEQTPVETFFRIILFKTFNKIETWELLKYHFGEINFKEYRFEAYDKVLMEEMEAGQAIYSAAYIMASGKSVFGHARKHQNHLKLIEKMIADEVPLRITELKQMSECYDLFRSYPTIGDFLAYQYATDINYSKLTDFTEMEFVVPGPGALDGIKKCFYSLGGLNEAEIIKMMADRQDEEFERLGIEFQTLWGRPLQLIDCQNLFCEVDKYSRVAHPDIKGLSNRTRIKQKFVKNPKPIQYWYPPKWGINDSIEEEQ